MTNHPRSADVAIVGSGPIGALVAHQVRQSHPLATIVMIEAGSSVGGRTGEHLLTATEESARDAYALKARAGVQTKYVGTTGAVASEDGTWQPGVLPLDALGNDPGDMPGAAVAWNVGGMGIHWSAACPAPYGSEIPAFLDPAEFDADRQTAEAIFSVRRDAYPSTRSSDALLGKLTGRFPTTVAGRGIQAMPMAGRHDETGLFHRTGPADVFPPLATGDDDAFTLIADTLCTGIVHSEGRAAALALRHLPSGETWELRATQVVVAADTLRSPQLLHASGIRPPALGRYLNDHVFLTGTAVVVDDEPVASRPDDLFIGAWWLPSSGPEQPFHGQMMDAISPETGEHRFGLSWYVPTELQAGNRVAISDTDVDALGMPRLTLHFALSEVDEENVRLGRLSQRRAADAVGTFDEETGGQLALGGSLHSTGTVRMGASDDGESVCDPNGRVWGFENVYVAGNGVVPTALSCNSTLTAATLAVRAARAVCRELEAVGAAV